MQRESIKDFVLMVCITAFNHMKQNVLKTILETHINALTTIQKGLMNNKVGM
jgi:hypothetical protein